MLADEDTALDLSPKAKVLGTIFLLLQLAFAAWRFGPHKIPVIRWFVDPPPQTGFVVPHEPPMLLW